MIFFWCIGVRFLEYRKAGASGTQTAGSKNLKNFPVYFWKTIGFCVVFFLVVPAIIYYLSYLPFSDGSGKGVLAQLIKNQETMFSYHSELVSEHPFSSKWYQWPIMSRPIWYYSSVISDQVAEGISAFGNPLVWWVGIPAFFYLGYQLIRKKDKTAGFLIVGYLAQYLPWVLIGRTTFIYHYFPSVPFVVLMIGYSIKKLIEKSPKWLYAAIGYVVAALLLFILFYPVLSGQAVSREFATQFLKWFPGWVLLA